MVYNLLDLKFINKSGMIFLLFFKIFFSVSSNESSGLSLEIRKDQVLSKKDNIELTFSANNHSKNNLILYNFTEEIEMNQFEESFYCNPEVTAGITLFIYDTKSEMMWPDVETSDSIEYKPMDDMKIMKLANQVRNNFRENKILAKAHQNVEIKRTVDLKPFHLKKGTYTLILIYFAGKNISNLVSTTQIESDQQVYNAKIYQGCVRSNKVTLVIE